eukprot:6645979-Prymnesium_polylepis.1
MGGSTPHARALLQGHLSRPSPVARLVAPCHLRPRRCPLHASPLLLCGSPLGPLPSGPALTLGARRATRGGRPAPSHTRGTLPRIR